MRGGRKTVARPMTIVRRADSRGASGADRPIVDTSGRAVRGNLPAELSSFIGRHRELGEVKRLMTTARLVTLTGIGGVGKTRLAQRVAIETRRAFPDGTWFVGLGDLLAWPAGITGGSVEQPDPDLVAELVGAALGLREQTAIRSVSALCGHFDGRRLLLVLDNC